MNRILQKIPFLRLLTALVIGIFAGSLINAGTLLIWLLSLNILIILIFAGRYYNYCMAPLFGVLTHLVFISIGIMLYQHHNSRPVFYKEGKFRATVMSIPREKKTNWQCLLRLDAFYSGDSVCATKEKILGSFEKDEVVSSLIPGQRIYFYGNPRLVQNRGNPFEFDYKRYLSRKKIYRKVYLPADKWMKSNESKLFTPALIAERFRMNLLSIYERMPLGKAESHILSAITLGYKSNIEPETKNLFLSAGAMHILAVSGLHVGIIYLMLSYIFGFLKSIKAGRPVFSLTVIFVLWLYALITGLSPSVMRATMMLSFVIVDPFLKYT